VQLADTVVIATQQPRGRLCEEGVAGEQLATALARIPETTRILSICTGSYVLAAGCDWALRRLREPLTLEDLARHGRVSVRTLTRRFREEVGLSPNRWVTQQRVDRARTLLETSDLPVESIAYESGFGSATALRQHLHAAIGVSPTAYRRTFRTAGQDPLAA
jgi:transcriptional regulator GlxA family with amidase domain